MPCPASITVMVLALSVGQAWFGLLAVACFSLGLAIALVGVGLAVVTGLRHLMAGKRLGWLSTHAPFISAWAIVASGAVALATSH